MSISLPVFRGRSQPCGRRSRRLAGGLGMAVLVMLTSPAARAATYTWTGAGGNAWSNPGSWQQNAAPPLSGLADSDLVFGNSGAVFPSINGAYSIHSLLFSAGASAHNFDTGQLTIGAGGLTQNAANIQNFTTAQVILGADQTWTLANGAGTLSFGAGVNTTGGPGNANRALTINAATTTGSGNTVNGVISGGGTLTKSGAGILTLTGANTYSGGTTFASGVLNAGSAGALGSTGTLRFTGGTLQYSTANQTDYSARFSTVANQVYRLDTNGQNVTFASSLTTDTGKLVKLGAGNLTLAGTINFTSSYSSYGPPAAEILAGTLTVGSGGSLADNSNLSVEEGATLALSGTGRMSLSFGAVNVFGSNAANLAAFTLSDTAILDAGYLSVSFGTGLQSGGAATLLAQFQLGSGSYTLAGGTLAAPGSNVSSLDGLARFTQSGGTHTSGTVALGRYSGTGTYALNGGTLAATSVSNGSDTSRGETYTGTGVLLLNGGTLQARANNTTLLTQTIPDGLTVYVQAGGARIDTAGFNTTVTVGLLHDNASNAPANDGGLTKLSTGTLTLLGTNTYNGATTISAGTLQVGGGGTTGTLGSGSVTNNAELTFNRSDNVTVANSISGSGDLIQAGTGTLTLTGASTYTGRTTVSKGILALGSGGSITGGELRVDAGATLTIRGTGSVNTSSAGTLTVDGTAASPASVTLEESGRLSTRTAYVGLNGTGSFTQSGGTFTTNGNPLFLGFAAGSSGTYTLRGGTLQAERLESRSGTATFHFNGGTLQPSGDNSRFFQNPVTINVQTGGARIDTNGFNITIDQSLRHDTTAGAPAIDGGLTKLGAGTLTLTGNNTFTGPLNIRTGTLAVPSEVFLGVAGDAVTVAGSGQLLFTGSPTLTRTYDLGIATLGVTSGNTLTLGGGATLNSGFLAGPGDYSMDDGSTLNATRLTGATALIQNDGTAHFNNVTLSGASTFTQPAGATVNVTGDFITTPAATVTIAGTFNVAGGSISGALTITSGGKVNQSGNSTPLYLDGNRGATIAAGGRLDAASGSSIELGGLLVNNGTQTGALHVNFGGLAKGSGSFGDISVSDNGRFSPGNSVGTATGSKLTLESGGEYVFELNSAGATSGNGSDFISLTDGLSITAGTTSGTRFTVAIVSLDFNNHAAALTDFNSAQPYSFTLATAGTGITGFDPSRFRVDTSGFANALNGGSFAVAQQGNNLLLNYSPVPEPGTAALLLVGAPLFVRRRRRTK